MPRPPAAALALERLARDVTAETDEGGAARRRSATWAVVLCTGLLLGALTWIRGHHPVAGRATIPSFPLLVLSMAGLLLACRRRWGAWVGGAVLAVDLATFAAAMRFGATRDELHRIQELPHTLAAALASLPTAHPHVDRADAHSHLSR